MEACFQKASKLVLLFKVNPNFLNTQCYLFKRKKIYIKGYFNQRQFHVTLNSQNLIEGLHEFIASRNNFDENTYSISKYFFKFLKI